MSHQGSPEALLRFQMTPKAISNCRMAETGERISFVLLARCQQKRNNEDETGGTSGMVGREEKYIEGLGRKPLNK
jgi:hypothetical protein